MRWGMAIEQKRCIGCYECVLACKAEHFLPPEIFWNRVLMLIPKMRMVIYL